MNWNILLTVWCCGLSSECVFLFPLSRHPPPSGCMRRCSKVVSRRRGESSKLEPEIWLIGAEMCRGAHCRLRICLSSSELRNSNWKTSRRAAPVFEFCLLFFRVCPIFVLENIFHKAKKLSIFIFSRMSNIVFFFFREAKNLSNFTSV